MSSKAIPRSNSEPLLGALSTNEDSVCSSSSTTTMITTAMVTSCSKRRRSDEIVVVVKESAEDVAGEEQPEQVQQEESQRGEKEFDGELAEQEKEEELEDDDDNDSEGAENDNSDMSRTLRRVYSIFNRHTEIYFGVDKDIGDLPKKRVRTAAKRTLDSLPSAADYISNNRKTKSTDSTNLCSAGYGEVTLGSFSKLLRTMQTKVPKELQLDKNSSFLDIGSGFGKCVVHAKLMGGVTRSLGLEYVKKRHEIATEVLNWLKEHKAEFHNQLDLSGVELRQQDATLRRKGFDCSHIYCFDYVFSQETREKLARLLSKSNFKLLACCTNPKKISAAGCPDLSLLHKFSIRTTGNQNFTMYLYTKNNNNAINNNTNTS